MSPWSCGRTPTPPDSHAWDGITGFSTAPLRMILWLGLLLCGAGLLYAAMLTAERVLQWFGFFPEQRMLGFTTLAVTVMTFGGLHLLCPGVIGEYLARICHEVKGRTHFIVGRIIENDRHGS